MNLVDQLQKLDELRAKGSISEGEYSLAKAKLLTEPGAATPPTPAPPSPSPAQPAAAWYGPVRLRYGVISCLCLLLIVAGLTRPSEDSLIQYAKQKWPPAGYIKAANSDLAVPVGGGGVYQDGDLLVCRWGIIGESRDGAPRVRVIGCFGHWFELNEIKE